MPLMHPIFNGGGQGNNQFTGFPQPNGNFISVAGNGMGFADPNTGFNVMNGIHMYNNGLGG